MQVGVLGPCQVHRDGVPVDLGVRKQRALVTALALYAGRTVPVDLIIDLLWGESPPPVVSTTLQAYVSGLRKALEPHRAPRAPATVLVTVGTGYALRVEPADVDTVAFAAEVAAAHRELAPVAGLVPAGGHSVGESALVAAVEQLDASLRRWRGEPYADLGDAEAARAERTRLDELRLLALEDRALARVWLGQHATVAPELEALTTAYPLRERLWGLHALALARGGRQADALEVLRRVRDVLDEDLGLEPGPELRALQQAVLVQDPALDWRPVTGPVRVVAAAAPPPAVSPLPLPDWPLAGRTDALHALVAALEQARAGRTAFAVLVGDPGIGKTRLAGELARVAVAQGVRVVLGRCSQDDGAPALYPWSAVLAGLDRELPAAETPFAQWDAVVDALAEAAQQQPTLVVLDDLHWADAATLRVLRLLAEAPRTVPLMVLATWRPHPAPTGPLADAAEVLARAHAVRLDLTGLDPGAVADLVGGLLPAAPDQIDALAERTDGNPFFVVEYARWAAERGDLDDVLTRTPPSAVQAVLDARLRRLPVATQELLRPAAVIGRAFDLGTLARTTDRDGDAVLDDLEPAQLADLITEEGVDRFRFGHALVREVVYAGVTASRRSRWHARVAAAVTDRPGREAEAALHWGAAGPAYADREWPAARSAAAAAARVQAHESRVALLEQARAAADRDPAVPAVERYELLLELIDGYRWTNRWPDLVQAVVAAIGLADELDDVVRLARAATAPTVGAIGRSAPSGELNGTVVDALRRCLTALPAGDGPERCRVLLSLANERYYDAPPAEREELVAQAHAMARRLDDWSLRLDADLIGFAATWRAGTAAQRLAWAEEGVELALAVGAEQAEVVAATMRAVALGELGRSAEMWRAVEIATEIAERRHIPFGLLVLQSLTLPWAVMSGDDARSSAQLEHLRALQARMDLRADDDAVQAALLAVALWRGDPSGLVEPLLAADSAEQPLASIAAVLLLRAGRDDEAAALLAEHPVRFGADDAAAPVNWAMAAEVALRTGDAALAADAYARLEPAAEQHVSWGSSMAIGPASAFLALAAAARGDRPPAGEHADRAKAVAAEQGLTRVADWLAGLRERYAF